MKLTDPNIIQSVRRIRERQNAQMEVAPWSSTRRFSVRWAAGLTAACVAGFLMGAVTMSYTARLTAAADAPMSAASQISSDETMGIPFSKDSIHYELLALK